MASVFRWPNINILMISFWRCSNTSFVAVAFELHRGKAFKLKKCLFFVPLNSVRLCLRCKLRKSPFPFVINVPQENSDNIEKQSDYGYYKCLDPCHGLCKNSSSNSEESVRVGTFSGTVRGELDHVSINTTPGS